MARAEAQTATTAALIPQLESQARQQIYALSVLLGQEPAALLSELEGAGSVPASLRELPAGLPSTLLQRRPDLRAAEDRLHAATARVGVAKADYFPKFTLTGSAGYRSNSSRNLLDWNNRYYSFGPSIDWRILDFGGLAAGVEASRAAVEESSLLYRKTALVAFQEVENALVAARRQRENLLLLQQAVAANRKSVELSKKLYAEGVAEFLDVLSAQQALLSTEEAEVSSRRNEVAAQIALFKAVGGGWDEASLETAVPVPAP